MSKWPTVPLRGHVSEVSIRKSDTPANVLSVTNVDGFVRSLEVFDKQVYSHDTSNYKLVQFNNLAYNPSRINVGSVARCQFKEGGAVSPMYVVVHCKKTLSPQFLLHFLKSNIGRQNINHKCVGAVRFMLRFRDLEQLELPLPPIAEQEQIVRVLDEAEALVRLSTQADHRTDALISGMFNSMFGDPLSNPKDSKVFRLTELTTRITDGVHLRPDYTESGVPFISVKDITTGKLKFDGCKYVSQADHERFTKRCKPEYLDILYTKIGATYGRAALVDTTQEFSIYVSVCLIKPDRSLVDSHFLNAAMNTIAVKRQADQRIKGIGVPDLHLDQIREFLIPLPPMGIQREFAAYVAQVHELEATQALRHTRLYDMYQSLLYRAFQGEI